MTINKQPQNPCHICNSEEFIWGRGVYEANGWIYFRADKDSWGDGKKLRARKCSQCGNVQFFADFD